MSKPLKPPEYRFCWWCSKQLYGPFGREVLYEGRPIRIHAACLTDMQRDGYHASGITVLRRRERR